MNGLSRKIGDIRLEPGDTILLQTRDDFAAQHRNNPHFYLVSGVEGYSPRRHDRALTARNARPVSRALVGDDES